MTQEEVFNFGIYDLTPDAANRRMHVVSRLVEMAEHAGLADPQIAEMLAWSREEYPDVFDEHARHRAEVDRYIDATLSPRGPPEVATSAAKLARACDDLVVVRQVVPADGGGTFALNAYEGTDAADDLAEVRSYLERGDTGNAWLAGGDARRHGAWRDDE